jgi:tetratricopeptide (TPR) repeat protein
VIQSLTYTRAPHPLALAVFLVKRMLCDSLLNLPVPPVELNGAVKAWTESVMIDTYEPHRPDRNPMFLENRVYQGSSGKVYPLPFFERISHHKHPREWQAVHIENEFLRVMILPELGGRIHVGLDKTNGYDFFYRQNVIKPALVGLAGPWISGGVELNWPQHHRPATYMPVQTCIEHHADGSTTVWCSDHDPFQRLKGTHGVCLHPGKALLELKVRLYNRTALRQTFLWWANAGVQVHELYQSFFPPDVHFVADHAKRAMSSYPFCAGTYYGVDYAKRAREGVPPDEMPSQFIPPGTYAPNDLRWYANIPVPTSYMALGSEADFFGGYDHRRRAGVVHVANHHIAPGKKQWTWGNHEFGYSWDRQLTDEDGPYIELMAGVFTDNQPDFSFLSPGETKTFSQYWYPIQGIGIAHAANTRAALHVETGGTDGLQVALYATERFEGARLTAGGCEWVGDLGPGSSAFVSLPIRNGEAESRASVILYDSNGTEILRYDPPAESLAGSAPVPASEPPPPAEVSSVEQLFLIGQHLEQYRHATRDPVDYWREALRRDPGDSRCLEALGLRRLRRGEFALAESLLASAVERLTMLNPNPSEGNAFYHLGLVRRLLGKEKGAYDALYKATWNFGTRSAAHLALAEIDTKSGRFLDALGHLEKALRGNADDLRARNLQTVLLFKLGRHEAASSVLAATAALDPTDAWTQYLSNGTVRCDNQTLLDIALDYSRAGLFGDASNILLQAQWNADDGSVPIVSYALAFLSSENGRPEESRKWLEKARAASADFCFPSRLEEILILEWAVRQNPFDGRARYYLGNLFYDKRHYEEAIDLWEASLRAGAILPTVWRNLGIAYYNVRNDAESARKAFNEAFALDSSDARIFFERDQLWKRIGVSPKQRLSEMEAHNQLVQSRDDLSIERIGLLNQQHRHDEALHLLSSRSFEPWEGGEGLVMEQHVRTYVALARQAIVRGDYTYARQHLHAALESPHNLGEAKHLLANRSNVYFWLGETFERLGTTHDAVQWWNKALSADKDFREMSLQSFSPMSLYRGLSFRRLGRHQEADQLFHDLESYATELMNTAPKIDYFATSLPNILLFRDNLPGRRDMLVRFLKAQVHLGLGESSEAEAILWQLLDDEPSRGAASDLLEESECLAQLASSDIAAGKPQNGRS